MKTFRKLKTLTVFGVAAIGIALQAPVSASAETRMRCVTPVGIFTGSASSAIPGLACSVNTTDGEEVWGWTVLAEPHPVLVGAECLTPSGKFLVDPAPAGSPCVVPGRGKGYIL